MRIYSLFLLLSLFHDIALGETPSPAPPSPPASTVSTTTKTASTAKPNVQSGPPAAEDLKEFVKAIEEERQELWKNMSPEDKKRLEDLAALIQPKPSGSLLKRRGLRRRRLRLVRRHAYSIDPPYLTPEMVLKDPDGSATYIPGGFLGSGSFGTVYKGTRITKDAKTEVALKVAPKHYDIRVLKQFKKDDMSDLGLALQNEYKILSTLHGAPMMNNYLIKPFALIDYKDRLVMALELAQLGSLDNYAYDHKATIREKMSVLICDIIVAVDEVHKANYAHRDLKPGNIFLKKFGENPHAVLGDFGTATPLNDPNKAQLGTALYAAPEFWTDRVNLDFRSAEAYSVGAILYFMAKPGHPNRIRITTAGEEAFEPIKFTYEEFNQDNFHPLLADLIQRLCWPDPKQRLSLTNARSHPFINPSVTFEDFSQKFPYPVDPAGVYNFITYRRGTLANRMRGGAPLPLNLQPPQPVLGPQPLQPGPLPLPQLGPQPLQPQPLPVLGPQPSTRPGPLLAPQPRPRPRLQAQPGLTTTSLNTPTTNTGYGPPLIPGSGSTTPPLPLTSASTSSTVVSQGPTTPQPSSPSSGSTTLGSSTTTSTNNNANSDSNSSNIGGKPPST